MSAGKTTVGALLAQQLQLPFLDTDQRIEQTTGLSINEIFKKKSLGEAYFRQCERDLMVKLQQIIPHVVSLGGGLILAAQNRYWLFQGYWFNLHVLLGTAVGRIHGVHNRPLMSKKNLETIRDLYQQRTPYYQMAPWQIAVDRDAPAGIVDRLMTLVRQI